METVKNDKSKIEYHLALAILRKLWVEGLITEDEMHEIDALNKITFAEA